MIRNSILLISVLLSLWSCRENLKRESINNDYYDVSTIDTLNKRALKAITDEEYLQYGANVAFLDTKGDTIIPFGKYAFYGTDTLLYYANVMEHPNDTIWGRQIAIDRNQNILFDIVMYDNGPDPVKEGLTRVLRNSKMGYANKYGKVVIPCIYDYAGRFENGKAKVTFEATEYQDMDEHKRVESDEWFEIDKEGKKVK